MYTPSVFITQSHMCNSTYVLKPQTGLFIVSKR